MPTSRLQLHVKPFLHKWARLPLALALALALALLVGLLPLFFNPSKPASALTTPPGFTDTLVSSVASPTALAFTPDGRLLVATAPGRLRVYQNGALLANPALDISGKVCTNGARGLLGVAVDPNFATNHYIYLFYTFKKHGVCDQNTANVPVNRVERYVLSDSNTATSSMILVDNIPNMHHDTTPATWNSARTATSMSASATEAATTHRPPPLRAGNNNAAREPQHSPRQDIAHYPRRRHSSHQPLGRLRQRPLRPNCPTP